jgi:exopolysaccharide biosynthesis protein
MRIKAFVLFVILTSLGYGQVWEKYFEPGLTLHVEIDWTTPRVIYAVRFNEKSTTISALSQIPNDIVLGDTPSKGRGTVSQAVAHHSALGGINADFFPFSGDPLGLLVCNGELISHPYPQRSVIAWGDGRVAIGPATWRATVSQPLKPDVAIDAVNAQCGPGQLILNTSRVGFAMLKGSGVSAVFKITEGTLKPKSTLTAIYQASYSNQSSIPVQDGNIVITASGQRAQQFRDMMPGDSITVRIEVGGFDWSQKSFAIGGGPELLRNGTIRINGTAQGFDSSLVNKRHPRTAIGRTSTGDIWYLVVDGRQPMSAGATLEETARILKRLGCVDGMNLDGGGSSCINLFGIVVNRPSDGVERPVADVVLFKGQTPEYEQTPITLTAPGQLRVGDQSILSIKNDKGLLIPNSEIVWSAQGAGWIDPGGLLRAISAGTTTVRAWVRGQVVEAKIQVVEGPKTNKT